MQQLQTILLIQKYYISLFLILLHRLSSITLKDEDGNVLSTGYLNQRVGSAIVDTGSYAVARLEPNANITTDYVTLSVPASAPSKVIIEAAIDNTYYHYNKTDQVTAPGMKQSTTVTITETAYKYRLATENHTMRGKGF
jgi:hypothetical protein